MVTARAQAASVYIIEEAGVQDRAAVDELWRSTTVRPALGREPTICLVARDPESEQVVGVAACYRTFPPEDALAAVGVEASARRKGVGGALLNALARRALASGIRNLAAFIAEDDVATWGLLCSVGMPIRVFETEYGIYVEIDLVDLLRRGSGERGDAELP